MESVFARKSDSHYLPNQTGVCFNIHFYYAKVARTDLHKISRIILSYPLAECFEFRACLAGRCLCSQNIKKYLNKPAKGHERIIIWRFSDDLATLISILYGLPHWDHADREIVWEHILIWAKLDIVFYNVWLIQLLWDHWPYWN